MRSNTQAALTIQTVPALSLDEISGLIAMFGSEQSFILRSEPGVGKSSTLGMVAKRHGDKWRKPGDDYPTDKYMYIYFDCPFRDIPDVVTGIPVLETKQIEQFITQTLRMHDKRPKVIMLDEVLKSPKLVQLIFMRLLLDLFIGDIPLPPGSKVYGTSNHTGDGVGDSIMAHGANRVTLVDVRKSSAGEFVTWAAANNISSTTRAWVAMTPSLMQSYRDPNYKDTNPHVFNPRKPNQISYASPRSIARNDVYVRNAASMPEHVLFAVMAGTIGASAAADLMTFIMMQASLTPPKQVLADPLGTPLPSSLAACCLLTHNLCDAVQTQDDLTAAATYINRLPHEESQAVFYTYATSDSKIGALAAINPVISQWIKTHDYELVRA
jgi:hypothetical protein